MPHVGGRPREQGLPGPALGQRQGNPRLGVAPFEERKQIGPSGWGRGFAIAGSALAKQEHARTGRLTRGVFFWGRFSGGYDVSTLFENPQGGTPCSLCGALITDENFDEDEVHFLPAHRGSEWAHKRCIDAAGGA